LQVQATEERLLHMVEDVLRQRQPCDVAMKRILSLCQEHLGVSGTCLVIPDKRITIVCGDAMSTTEVELQCQTLINEARNPDFDTNAVSQRKNLLWMPVHARGQEEAQGIFALIDWEQSDFSQRRLARVARYVGSHLDSALDRDFDPLTGLMAWPVFERELTACLEDGQGEAHSVMYFDVDQLHVVNDNFGRDAGDEILKQLAALLREMLSGHPVSRVTGDHFAALLRHTSIEDARRLAEDICGRFREQVYVRGDQSHRPSVSVGIGSAANASGPSSGSLAAAQVACQAAKDRGRARVEVFESGDASIVRRFDDIQVVGYVRNAIENGRLALLGQRIMALKPGRVPHYYEVLVRLVDEAGQHVPPADFLSAAERYQLMEDLDRWVVGTTLKLLASSGRNLRGGEARFAINLSGQSLGSDSFLSFVENRILESGVAPELITFEITESVAVARMQQAQSFMHALKRIGCRFSLDDFGTGLSSFAYLKLFPVDTLKIDGSFVRDVTTNVVSQSVVAAIAEVARVMQLETVAEYVQDQAALELLRSLNITYVQGYLIGQTEPLENRISVIDGTMATGVVMPLSSGTTP
jgi:diguanylate cyclase (GGDEF)-like protein